MQFTRFSVCLPTPCLVICFVISGVFRTLHLFALKIISQHVLIDLRFQKEITSWTSLIELEMRLEIIEQFSITLGVQLCRGASIQSLCCSIC